MFEGKVILRKLKPEDLDDYYLMTHPSKKFHEFDGPYYEKETVSELKDKIEKWRSYFKEGNLSFLSNRTAIVDEISDKLIGEVSWYWKSEETLWMEVGITIFNEEYWGKGIGYVALKSWINHIFETNTSLKRIGLTTWSGNKRMMKLSEKLGLHMEARFKDARIVNNIYYDSISYGIIKSEWLENLD